MRVSASANVHAMAQVRKVQFKLLLTVSSVLPERSFCERTVLFASLESYYREEQHSPVRSALILYFRENKELLEAKKGVFRSMGFTSIFLLPS